MKARHSSSGVRTDGVAVLTRCTGRHHLRTSQRLALSWSWSSAFLLDVDHFVLCRLPIAGRRTERSEGPHSVRPKLAASALREAIGLPLWAGFSHLPLCL